MRDRALSIIYYIIYNLNMNVFEMMATNGMGYEQSIMQINTAHSHWTTFQTAIHTLLYKQQYVDSIAEMWHFLMHSSPQLVRTCINHYTNELQSYFLNALPTVMKSLQSDNLLQTLQTQLLFLARLHTLNAQFLQHIAQPQLSQLVNHKLSKVVKKYQLLQQLQTLAQIAFKNHCLKIVNLGNIDFDQQTINYVKENCRGNPNIYQYQLQSIRSILNSLNQFKLLQEAFEPIAHMLHRDNQKHIQNTVDLSQNNEFLSQCLSYHRTFHKSFVLSVGGASLEDSTKFLIGKHSFGQIFDIVKDFPESMSTIVSLKKCLEGNSLLQELGSALRQEMQKRLLIPGVLTQLILNHYINILKVLQILDPQGAIFDAITIPIKNYLLRREDTLRCIISHLTLQNYSRLTKEVVKIPSTEQIDDDHSDEDEQAAANEWHLLDVHESKSKKRIKYHQIDLVAVLVGLYGSQQAFISQYQTMLGEKLMSVKECNIEEQVRNIQLLKMRFGQAPLQTCNIIVKDLKDSRRIDNQIHKQAIHPSTCALPLAQLHCLTVSRGYWPIHDGPSTFQIPQQFKSSFDEYGSAFARIKAMRKMSFHPHFGHVQLTLYFQNTSLQVRCLPIQALIIHSFDEVRVPAQGLSLESLGSRLAVPLTILKQKISFWVHKGVLSEVSKGDSVWYRAVDVYHHAARDEIDQDQQNDLVKEAGALESHLKYIIEEMILDILLKYGPKASDKVHLILKSVYRNDLDHLFAENQTSNILKKMVQKKKIHFNGQTYSLRIY